MTRPNDSDDRSTETNSPTESTLDADSERDPLFDRIPRRDFMKAGAATGAMASMAGCTGLLGGDDSVALEDVKTDVKPGEHDDYYAFLSGGHTGEIRVYGLPSMRQLMRIPVFGRESARGYGYDDRTSEMLEDAGGYSWGDTHHPRVSQTDNDYDGRWAFVNDKANGRMARINLKYFETDAIVDIPNQQGTHGACCLLPDTKYVFGVGEFRVPMPNDGQDLTDPENYTSVIAAINPETMNVEWEVLVDGNMDNGDGGKEGRWFFTTGYNSEHATTESEMSSSDTDWVKAFDVPAIEEAVEAGEYDEMNGVPVVDGTRDSALNEGDRPIVRYIDVSKSPHGVSVTPDGQYAIASGKLDPTATVIDIETLAEADDPNESIVGRPRLGMGPLHTAYDGRGHAYTTLFIDSQVVKWDIEAAVEASEESTDPVIEKIDVHYNPGHLIAAESYTTDPQGDWLISLNKLSKDRFLPVGPMHPENDQLIYIGDDEEGMSLVKDTPSYAEPHDASIVSAEKLDPAKVYDPEDYDEEFVGHEDIDISREDGRVHVKMYSTRNEFGFEEVTVTEGDEVTMTVTNIEQTPDILHSIAIPEHDINMKLAPQETREVTFTADEPGVYWMYCAFFCSALHLEMRSRLIVEPAE
ncbi:TAT-dependent nitrous-oxide reductase [Natrinema longum]|uniref:Nitrous-oxide reductase n=1 Tax=Natrinema longum TaxID=370324 RepID=A0A8A2U5D8_9EURY|nr:TAT-dependent nitrous-oxide reductase [Natrinema longum]MBZ6494789.1 nitrous-oxide reductase [Natrinema longum]QSW83903.1 nitrous-oxide reductase [Natrinema longum]